MGNLGKYLVKLLLRILGRKNQFFVSVSKRGSWGNSKIICRYSIMSNQATYMKNSAGDSWQRLAYDPITYETDLRQSTRPLLYRIDPIYANPCGQLCRPGDIGYISRIGTSIDKRHSLVDTDSELKLLNYRASKSPQHQYHPTTLGGNSCKTGYPGPEAGGIQFEVLDQDKCRNPSDKWHFPECGKLRTEYTRVSHPTCDLKGTGVNRFQPICLDPQHPSRWEHPSEIGVNYRMVVKDNHRPCIPKPIDQTLALPKSQADAIKAGSAHVGPGGTAIGGGSGIRQGMPKQKVTLTYCTTPYQDYGHNLFCDASYSVN